MATKAFPGYVKASDTPLVAIVPKLVYKDPESGQEVGVEISEQMPEITIGRNPGNVVRVNNPSISRQHAKVVYDNGQCTLIDLDSSNGSYINGNRIRTQVLVDGDRIRVGEFPVDYVGLTDGATAEVDQEVIDSVLRGAGAPNGDFRRQTALGGFEAEHEVAEQSGPFGQWGRPPESPQEEEAFNFVDSFAPNEPKVDSGPLTLPDDAILPVSDDSDAELVGDELIMDEDVLPELSFESSEGDADLDTYNAPADEIARNLRHMDNLSGQTFEAEHTEEDSPAHHAGLGGGGKLPEVAVEPVSLDAESIEPLEAPAKANPELESRIKELESERDELLDLLQNRSGDAGGASQVQIDRLRNERDRLIEERRNLKRQISDLQQDLKKAPDAAQFEQMKADLEDAQKQIVALEDDISARADDVQERDDQLAAQETQMEFLQAELDQYRAAAEEGEELGAQLTSARGELTKAREEFEQAAQQITVLQEDLGAAQDEIQQLVGDLEMREQRLAELEAELADTQLALQDATQGFEAATAEVESANARIAELEGQNSELKSELESRPLPDEVEQVVKDLAQTRGQLDSVTAERDKLLETKKNLEGEIADLKKTAKDRDKRYAQMEKELTEVTKERDTLKTEKGAFARETDYLQVERRKLDSELRDLRKQVSKLEKDDKRKKQVFAELSGDLKKLVGENNKLQKTIEDLHKQLDAAPSKDAISEVQSELAAAHKTIKGLEKDTSNLTRELGSIGEERDKLQKDLDAQREELDGLRKTADDEQAARKKLEEDLEKLQAELEEARKAAEGASDGADEIDSVRKKLAEAEQTLAEVILERDKLEDQLKKKK